jgi:serine/threonine-protein kinase
MTDERGHPVLAVHRDVATDNLLVGLDGRTRITDFGSVKRAGVRSATTQDGILKGKFAYMAPEYLMGYATDARADVFSLGVVAWEVLAGKHPFKAATTAATMQRVARMEAPRLSTTAPGVGAAFDAVLGRALTKNPALRFASIGAFAHELAAAAAWAGGIADPTHVGATVEELAGGLLDRRRADMEEEMAPLWETSGVRRCGPSFP